MTVLFNSSPQRVENNVISKKLYLIQSGLGPDSYLYGIEFSRVSSSRLPVNDDVVQFIPAARRKQCYQ